MCCFAKRAILMFDGQIRASQIAIRDNRTAQDLPSGRKVRKKVSEATGIPTWRSFT
jgi:hypothetical protein